MKRLLPSAVLVTSFGAHPYYHAVTAAAQFLPLSLDEPSRYRLLTLFHNDVKTDSVVSRMMLRGARLPLSSSFAFSNKFTTVSRRVPEDHVTCFFSTPFPVFCSAVATQLTMDHKRNKFPNSRFLPRGSNSARIHDKSFRSYNSSRLFSTISNKSNSEGSINKTLVDNGENDLAFYTQEEVIKKSRFIGMATHCSSWNEAQLLLAQVKKEHPKARHICFGFVSTGKVRSERCSLIETNNVGEDPAGVRIERCSDDGEPTGTAGVPILGAIKGLGLSDTLCIIVRYFGGVKLGAGGLIRAYSSAARLVLQSAPTRIVTPQRMMRLSIPLSSSGAVYVAVAKYGGVTSHESYDNEGTLEIDITCNEVHEEMLRRDLLDATKGAVLFL